MNRFVPMVHKWKLFTKMIQIGRSSLSWPLPGFKASNYRITKTSWFTCISKRVIFYPYSVKSSLIKEPFKPLKSFLSGRNLSELWLFLRNTNELLISSTSLQYFKFPYISWDQGVWCRNHNHNENGLWWEWNPVIMGYTLRYSWKNPFGVKP